MGTIAAQDLKFFFGDNLSVRMLGCIVDGVTDDTVNFQKAINSAAATGTALMIPGDAPLVCTGVTFPSNLILIGRPGAIVRQKSAGATSSTPFITNVTHSGGGNANITLQGITFDGNSASQTATNVDILSLLNAQNVLINDCNFINAVRGAVFGQKLTNITVKGTTFLNWAGGNVGAIYLAARAGNNFSGPGGTIEGVSILGCIVDGRVSHSSCIKLDSDSSNVISDIVIQGNRCYPGDGSGISSDTLGIEIYSNDPGTSSNLNFTVDSNIVTGENSTGSRIFGISLGGAGCINGSVTGNAVTNCQSFGIEIIGTQISVSANSVDHSGPIDVDSGSASCAQIAICNNVIRNPQAASGHIIAIHIIAHSTSGPGPYTIIGVEVKGNVILSSSSASTDLITVESQVAGYNISDIQISGNHIIGPGSTGSGLGIGPNTGTVQFVTVRDNHFSNLSTGIYQGGTNTRYLFNRFENVTAQYGTTFPSDAMVVDIDTGDANFTPQTIKVRGMPTPTLDTAGNIVLPGSGAITTALITDGTVPASPNILAINNANFGLGNGAVISVNSKFTGFPNWAILSDGSISSAALFLVLGVDRMQARFGNATNTQGAIPGSVGFEIIQGDGVYTGSGYPLEIEASGSRVFAFAGSPNTYVTANPGSICLDTNGNSFWVKTTGIGNTGWLNISAVFTASLSGLVPASGGGTTNFLRADGNWAAPGAGTVTSVALSLPGIFTVSGSPVISSGTLTAVLANENINLVFAGPSSGSAAAPTFRALVAADIAGIAVSSLDTMTGAITITVSNSGTGGARLSGSAGGGVEAFTLTQPGAWTDFSGSMSWGGVSSVSISSARWEQTGKTLRFRFKVSATGTGGTPTFTLPVAVLGTDQEFYVGLWEGGLNSGLFPFSTSSTTATGYTTIGNGIALVWYGMLTWETS